MNKAHTFSKVFFTLLLISLTTVGYGQTTDTELWTGPSLGIKFNKHFDFSVEQQFRFDNHISTLKKDYSEFGLRYKINKYISFNGYYRYISIPKGFNNNRLAFDAKLIWSKKKFPLRVDFRFRAQQGVETVTLKKTTYLRNKLGLEYNLTKLVDPKISYEIYYRLNGKNQMRIMRFTLGLDWKITQKISLSTFCRFQKDMNRKVISKKNIIGITATYNFKLKSGESKRMDVAQ